MHFTGINKKSHHPKSMELFVKHSAAAITNKVFEARLKHSIAAITNILA
jgi:hypothetical protein